MSALLMAQPWVRAYIIDDPLPIVQCGRIVLSAGVDYIPGERQLEFFPGDFEEIITIMLTDDITQEDQELFFVSLHSPVSNLMVELPNPNSIVFIIDDDRGMKDSQVNSQNDYIHIFIIQKRSHLHPPWMSLPPRVHLQTSSGHKTQSNL